MGCSSSRKYKLHVDPLVPVGANSSRSGRGSDDPSRWKLSSFEVGKVIGTGVHSRVFVAKSKKSGVHYALKRFNKKQAAKKKRVEFMEAEMAALKTCNSPFIVKCHGSFQDQFYVYFVLDYFPGGELYSFMQSAKRLNEDETKFYLAETVLALEEVHSHSLMYRDLKPENMVLSATGHVRLVDFGFCMKPNERGFLYNKVGTAHYLAPELLDKNVKKHGYTVAVDWWAFGCLMFEMLAGKAAFGSPNDNAYMIYTRIIRGKLSMPGGISPQAKSLIKGLLTPDPSARVSTAGFVRHHPFFKGMDWAVVAQQRFSPPYVPPVKHPGDDALFDTFDNSVTKSKPNGAEDAQFAQF